MTGNIQKTAKKKRKLKFSTIWKVLVVVVPVLATLIVGGAEFFTDLIWFKEMGYLSVFLTKLKTQLMYGIPLFVVIAIVIFIYLKSLMRDYFRRIKSEEKTDMRKLNRITLIFSAVFALIFSFLSMKNLWFEMLQFLKSSDFNIKDPLFGMDVSFYVFKLEFLQKLNGILILAIAVFFILTAVYYGILLLLHSPDAYDDDEPEPYKEGQTGNAGAKQGLYEKFAETINNRTSYGHRWVSNNNFKEIMALGKRQFIILGIIMYLMLEVFYFFKQFDVLHSHTGAVYGAGFVNVNVDLWIYRILMVVCVFGIISILLPKLRKAKVILAVPAAIIVIGVAGSIVSILTQNFIVAPDEINKEAKYLAHNIEFTRYAYDINDVKVQPFEANNQLTVSDIAANNETISNIRINDYDPVKTFYNQTQSIRQYYKFNDIDVDRYTINGKYTQTYMSLREIDEEKVNNTWLNRHLKYTHGYGLALSRVDTITPSGQPDVLIGNIPPESTVDMNVTRPQIYFGELSNDYIIVGTNEDEFDYPNGQSNKYNRYKGKAGISLNPLNRLLFAIREGSMKLLVSTNINSNSKIIIYRNVIDRVKKIMPYLQYESDPYSVMMDGKLYWMVDAYTTSNFYPYSVPYKGGEGVNYIRNSVKVVVDAYNGNVDFYMMDDKDPIVKTMSNIYPTLFKKFEQMPKTLQEHIRYPNNLVKIQAQIYGRYHMDDVKVFYQNEDLWDIAHEIYGTKEREMKPNYYIAKLPGEEKAEFISVLPFTPKSKQNMTGLMVARSDGNHYGQLVVYQFPKNRTVYGPMQIEAQIDQNTKISQDFSLWSQAGSTYNRGNLFVVPVENSLLYVEPIYLEASNSAIPEVKRVVVAYGDRIAYEPTLAEALTSLFGDGIGLESVVEQDGTVTPGDPDTVPGAGGTDGASQSKSQTKTDTDYIAEASKAYDDAQAAVKNGDWAAYGQQMDKLKNALDQLAKGHH